MIYITGASGFIGSRVARRLVERGMRIRCLVRSRERAQMLEQLGAELIMGDVTDVSTHLKALEGATGALHLAALYDVGIVDRAALQRTNVEGTRAFLKAIETAHTPRAVYISSTVALGPSRGEADEPREAYDGPYHSEYHRTKAEAHRLAREAQRRGIPLIIVCPAFVYGPGDAGPAGRFVTDLTRRKVPALLTRPSWFSYAYVNDVAEGIVAALERGKVGEVYLLTGEEASMNDFAQRIARAAHVKAPVLRLPVSIARGLARVFDPVARATGLRFPITREAVSTTAVDRWLHKSNRAVSDLGYASRPLDEGVQETVIP